MTKNVVRYTKTDFERDMLNENFEFIRNCVKIINSHERSKCDFDEKVLEFLSDCYEHFTGNENGCAYMLLVNDMPTSMCMLANTAFDNDVLAMEMIWTHKEKLGNGYGRYLFNEVLKDLAKNENLTAVSSTIEINNEKSLDMHKHFINNDNVKVNRDETRIQYEIPLVNYRNTDDEEDVF